jgi:transglutaminase-like putative cysteine protease
LWEEFYPRIRHESSAEEAARIVVRHLRERVTVVAGPNLPRTVPDIWLRQLTDQTGFEIIYVAALRSVGVPARLDAKGVAEFITGEKWQTAPDPVVLEAWKNKS